MKRRAVQLLSLIAFAAVLGAASSRAQEPTPNPAQASAEAWLSLVDNQNYAASWDAAASAFRSAITKEKWEAAVRAVRTPLGPMKVRELASAKSTTTLPGAPDGEYVVFQFNTGFEQKAAAVETVTEVKENDGTWHVGGYFIR